MATPSIAMIPSGYKDGKVYSVLPSENLYGSELITNGDFDGNASGWNLQVGWAYNGNKVSKSLNNSSYLLQTSTLTIGKKYKVTFTISDYVSGEIGLNSVFWGTNNLYSTNGTYEVTAITTSASFYLYSNASFVGSIDNISVVEDLSGDFNFTRGSAATRVNAQGLVENVQIISSELVTNGNWNSHRAAEFEITDNLIYIENNGNTYGGIEQFFSVSSGKIFQLKYNAIEGATSSDWRFDVGSFQGGTDLYSKGQVSDFTENTLITSTTSEIWIRTYNNTPTIGDNFSVDNVSVKEITDDTDTPRLDYSDGSCPSLLLEPQSTNLIPYSEDFSQWQNGGGTQTIIQNAALSPEGVNNASSIQIDSGYVYNQISGLTVSNGDKYTWSCYISSSSQKITFGGGTVVGTDVYSSEDVGNGWYKQKITRTFSVNGTIIQPMFTESQSGTDLFYIWGAQLEQLSYATSYIPTNGSIATRLADQATGSGNSSLINSTEGVLYVEASSISDLETTSTVFSLNDGTNQSEIQIGFTDNPLRLYTLVRVSNTVSYIYYHNVTSIADNAKIAIKWKQDDFCMYVDGVLLATHTVSSSGVNYEDINKIAIKYKTNDISFWLNGTKVGTDITGTLIPNKFTQLGFNSGGGGVFYGKVKAVAVYKEALTDAELQSLTTI